jgi:hypothetical protein
MAIVEHAPHEDVRMDTTLRELFSDARPFDVVGSR